MLPIGAREHIKQLLGIIGLFGLAQSLYTHLAPQGRKWRMEIEKSEQKLLPLYGQFVRPGNLVFDVGANYGTRVDIFLKLGASVVAIEPNPDAARNLRLRFRRNLKVVLVEGGLDEKEGSRELRFGEYHAVSSMSPQFIEHIRTREGYEARTWEHRVSVPVTTLDALIARHGMPSFCKIDVEGFEYQVLKGLSSALSALSFEYNAEYLEPALASLNRLVSLGSYECNILDEDRGWLLDRWIPCGDMASRLPRLTKEKISGDIFARLAP